MRASLCGATESGRGHDGLRTFQTLEDVKAWVINALEREQQFFREFTCNDDLLDEVEETGQD